MSEREAYVGQPRPRREDHRLLAGLARYVDDIKVTGALHAAFLRSPHGHARIVSIDVTAALELPGVVTVVTGEDLAEDVTDLTVAPPIEGLRPTSMPVMPVDRVRFQGDLVACVVAADRYVAEEAMERIVVEYAELPAVSDMFAALRDDSVLVDEALGTNLVARRVHRAGDPEARLAAAPRVIEAEFHQQRQTHAPIETRGCIAQWDPGREHLTLVIGSQVPHPLRTQIVRRLGLRDSQVSVSSPDVGGSFGQKIALYREELAICALARRLGRPVRWKEDRMENLLAACHAREQWCRTRAAVDDTGRILGLTLEMVEDFGAYCFYPANYISEVVGIILTAQYGIADYGYEIRVALTNKCGVGPMRAPMAMASWVMEGTLDVIARRLGLDPAEVRRRNMLADQALPYAMPGGETLLDVNCAETMETALDEIGYAAHRPHDDGRYLYGLGLCNVVESTTYGSRFYKNSGIGGSGHEAARIIVEPDGTVSASVGMAAAGQGYETTFAQVVADGVGVRPDDVAVTLGHSDTSPYGMGSRGGRGATAGGGALYLCAAEVRAHLLRLAAHRLGLNATDGLGLRDGRIVWVRAGGSEETGLDVADLARTAYFDPLALPEGMRPGLEFYRTYDPPPMTFSNSTHACRVRIARETGRLEILDYLVVENCGTVINPLVVHGQQAGAVAMGLSGTLLENVVYDQAGRNLSATFADYTIATVADIPAIRIIARATPSSRTPLGLKGMAEGGVMGAIGAVANAVNDALSVVGAQVTCLPLTPMRLHAAIHDGIGRAAQGQEG
ncbi:xanthine dehydrogenase family protein molybdopterin-binding subunit [Gluconacetobacter tumulicola]|uniref:Xanthine dehydrogenase family protein molybdopterin-binding subunit n=1 Tax=Gluconacetobacter tumulicola TaxID=1017177 RepID=A0A7W4PBG8_9PROT|nr:xanthine dehydrogenase family protein molybdopterin-binding subunit [Gluconacetobacter tumulicola]MBB2181125.1 xanthine dehydrogenase family protein molybdopterin-binding subunit [Gluconacetobacter tumulicola]